MSRVLVIFLALALSLSYPAAMPAKTSTALRYGINNMVCVTVDDGYGRANIKRILDTLRAKHIKCTFFVIGRCLKNAPDLWRQAVKDGHEICYHTMHHTALTGKSLAYIARDLSQWNATARSVLGSDYSIPKLARLPGGCGNRNQRILDFFSSRGYRVIGWSSDILTAVLRSHHDLLTARINSYIKHTTRKNTIILLHFNSADANALPTMLQWLHSHFHLGTVTQALNRIPEPAVKPYPSPTRIVSPCASTRSTASVQPRTEPLPSATHLAHAR